MLYPRIVAATSLLNAHLPPERNIDCIDMLREVAAEWEGHGSPPTESPRVMMRELREALRSPELWEMADEWAPGTLAHMARVVFREERLIELAEELRAELEEIAGEATQEILGPSSSSEKEDELPRPSGLLDALAIARGEGVLKAGLADESAALPGSECSVNWGAAYSILEREFSPGQKSLRRFFMDSEELGAIAERLDGKPLSRILSVEYEGTEHLVVHLMTSNFPLYLGESIQGRTVMSVYLVPRQLIRLVGDDTPPGFDE